LLEKGIHNILSAKTYVHNELSKLENMFDGGPFKKCSTPMMELYHPELDGSPLLDKTNHSKYIVHWLDQQTGSTLLEEWTWPMPQTLWLDTPWHLEKDTLIALKRVFRYLRKHPTVRFVLILTHRITPRPFRSSPPMTTGESFIWMLMKRILLVNQLLAWKRHRLPSMLMPTMTHDQVMRRWSMTGMILFLNGTPVRWISKRQKTIETSTYGSY
jgi:hypothetical protein